MEIKTKFSIGDTAWYIEYDGYKLCTCPICNGVGKVSINSKVFSCPECDGDGKLENSMNPYSEQVKILKIDIDIEEGVATELYYCEANDGYTTWKPALSLFATKEDVDKEVEDSINVLSLND